MEKDDLDNIQLTVSQNNVLNQLTDFINHPTDRIFILKGYAGTGKTTLMRFLIKHLNCIHKNYRLLASTGRAAKILTNISSSMATTVHSMIYHFKGLNEEPDSNWDAKIANDGQLFLVFSSVIITKSKEKEPEVIYIIDEASMVSDVAPSDISQAKFGEGRLLKELLKYDERPQSKFIFIGDPCQLPPIEQYFSPALTREYFARTFGMKAQEAQLTEIMRQQDGNGIIKASKIIRGLYNQAPEDSSYYGSQLLWGFLPFRNSNDIQLHANLEDMINDYVEKIQYKGLNDSICICRTNKACSQLSDIIRHKLGKDQGIIQKGTLLMVIQNNNNLGLLNGDMVVVEDMNRYTEKRAQLTFRQVKVRELFTKQTYNAYLIEEVLNQSRLNLDKRQQHSLFVDFIMRMKKKGIDAKCHRDVFYNQMYIDPYLNALRCTYGYAITCHKAQGGEWENVYIHVPRNITKNPTKETYQWIYTAMTRAKSKLHMVNDFFIR